MWSDHSVKELPGSFSGRDVPTLCAEEVSANAQKSREKRARPERGRHRLAGATAGGTRGCRGGGARREAQAGRAR